MPSLRTGASGLLPEQDPIKTHGRYANKSFRTIAIEIHLVCSLRGTIIGESALRKRKLSQAFDKA